MKVEYINPFINATRNLMTIMAGIKDFKKKELILDQQMRTTFDISAVIGVTGDCRGSIVLSFSKKVAVQILARLVGEPVTEFDDDICDAVGEMVNVISGNAQAELLESGIGNFDRSLPNVIVGKDHVVRHPQNTPCINIFFERELGGFAVQVSLKWT